MKPETLVHLKKLRVQQFDENMNQLADRLVAQDLEFKNGPKEPHKGPMKLEICLFERGDIDMAIDYIKALVGDIPLAIVAPKIKKSKVSSDDPTGRDAFMESIREMESQDDIIKALRDEGFVFVTGEHLSDMGYVDWEEGETFYNLQWMIKLMKEAKNPMNNKYDPTFMVGFQLMGEKQEQVILWSYGKADPLMKPWKNANKVTFKKTEMVKFPSYMVAEEREKFRIELYKARKDPDNHKFSKFFRRWYKDVTFKEKATWEERINAL